MSSTRSARPPAAAQTEAGVVLSELKLRDTPSFRAARTQLEFLLKDPHAAAYPTGDPAIVAQASVAAMRDFYDAYYRPERATLVVVGDIDPDQIEARIRNRFAGWRGRGKAGADPVLAIDLTRPRGAYRTTPLQNLQVGFLIQAQDHLLLLRQCVGSFIAPQDAGRTAAKFLIERRRLPVSRTMRL